MIMTANLFAQGIKIPKGAEMEKIIDQLAAQGLFSKADAQRAKNEMKKMDKKQWKAIEKQANSQVEQLMKSGDIEKLANDPNQLEKMLKKIDPSANPDPKMLEDIKKKMGNLNSLPNQKQLMELINSKAKK